MLEDIFNPLSYLVDHVTTCSEIEVEVKVFEETSLSFIVFLRPGIHTDKVNELWVEREFSKVHHSVFTVVSDKLKDSFCKYIKVFHLSSSSYKDDTSRQSSFSVDRCELLIYQFKYLFISCSDDFRKETSIYLCVSDGLIVVHK